MSILSSTKLKDIPQIIPKKNITTREDKGGLGIEPFAIVSNPPQLKLQHSVCCSLSDHDSSLFQRQK
jgi:hypothetical protein